MTLSNFLIRIIFLVLPGIFASVTYRKLRGRTVRKDWEDYVEILLFSLLSYSVFGLVVFALNKLGLHTVRFTVFQAFVDDKAQLIWHEIIPTSFIGVSLAFAAAYVHTYKLINRLGRWAKVTKRFGEEDIWHFLHNRPEIYWVYVRDHKYDLSYRCWIEAYSDPYKERELLLRDVDVYRNSTGDALYHTDVLYFSRKNDEFTIEAAIVSETINEEGSLSGTKNE